MPYSLKVLYRNLYKKVKVDFHLGPLVQTIRAKSKEKDFVKIGFK